MGSLQRGDRIGGRIARVFSLAIRKQYQRLAVGRHGLQGIDCMDDAFVEFGGDPFCRDGRQRQIQFLAGTANGRQHAHVGIKDCHAPGLMRQSPRNHGPG